MKNSAHRILSIGFLTLGAFRIAGWAQPAPSPGPYRLERSAKVGGPGGFDYVLADAQHRRLYVPRGDRVTVFDLDSLAPVGVIAQTPSVHGVAIDPLSGHAFASCQPVAMWDADTLAPLKTVAVAGRPDGILFEPATERIYVLSHRAPNVTVLDAKDATVVGTIDLGGAPEQAASDGHGRVFIDVEDRDQVAVVDAHSLRVTARYGLAGHGGGPGALALDAAHHILFVCCHDPATAVMLNADTGSILATLPIGRGVDAAEFNPATGECFSSQGDGTLTVIKENGPAGFVVEQTVGTRSGARTSTLDAKTNRIFLVTADYVRKSPPDAPAPAAGSPTGAPAWRRGMAMVPDSFSILMVGSD